MPNTPNDPTGLEQALQRYRAADAAAAELRAMGADVRTVPPMRYLPVHGPELPDAYAFVVGPAGASTTNPRESWMFTASRLSDHGAAYERAARQYFAAVNRSVPLETVRVLARWPR